MPGWLGRSLSPAIGASVHWDGLGLVRGLFAITAQSQCADGFIWSRGVGG